MSKIKDLRNKQENNLNLVDFFSLLCPEGKESKYVNLMMRMTINTNNIDDYSHKVKSEFKEVFNLNGNKLLESFSPVQAIMMDRMLGMYERADLKTFQKFCDYNERGLIENNDLTRIKTLDEISKSVSLVDMKLMEKEMSKQIHVIYRDDEWLLLRPLTYLSSKKYGANTKWCTSSEDTSDQFERYTNRGILIYCLNMKTGLKIACFRELPQFETNRQNYEFSFWNQLDDRIDSLDSDLPNDILTKIKLEISEHKVSNYHFVKLYKLEDKYLEGSLLKNLYIEREEGRTFFATNMDSVPTFDTVQPIDEEIFERRENYEQREIVANNI